MAEQMHLMVLPSETNNRLPLMFLLQDGIWRDVSASVAERSFVQVPELRRRMNALLIDMMNQVQSGAQPKWTRLRAEFRQLFYEVLVPQGVRQALAQLAANAVADQPPLLMIYVHPAADWLPWEIFHDGQNFLGLRFLIARLPIIAPKVPLQPQPGPRLVGRVYNFLGENVFEPASAPALTQQWSQTFDGLTAAVDELRFPANHGAPPVFPNLDHLMEAGLDGDILHITCHGGLRDPANGEIYWTLNHLSTLPFDYNINESVLKNLGLFRNPLVFGNACASGQVAGDQGEILPGFGSVLFAQGVSAFIGTFAPITQTMAVRFAAQFYRTLLGAPGQAGAAPSPGLPVGRALYETRRHFFSNNDADPSYLFYVLYGPPETGYSLV
jgi:hypothetical protein